jgi:hypothetical protein
LNAVLNGADKITLHLAAHPKAIVGFHGNDPSIGLQLWVNHQGPPVGLFHHDLLRKNK